MGLFMKAIIAASIICHLFQSCFPNGFYQIEYPQGVFSDARPFNEAVDVVIPKCATFWVYKSIGPPGLLLSRTAKRSSSWITKLQLWFGLENPPRPSPSGC